MGELIDVGADLGSGGISALSAVISLVVLGVYALLSGRTENDDDDSSPGGGLMQPVA